MSAILTENGPKAEARIAAEVVTNPACFVNPNAAEFRAKFDQMPFEVNHSFYGSHPLFTLPRLKQLSAFLRTNGYNVHLDAGDVKIGQRWDEVPPHQWSFEETMERIEHAGAWIILKQVEKDPEYAELLEQFVEQLSSLTGRDVKREARITEVTIFITSPLRITSYHIDRECNFLLQVSGEKDMYIFDRTDREVLPEHEIERFWSVDNNAPVYREQYQDRALTVRLRPGSGVHVPVNCPHWLKNGNNVSISLSVSYQFHDSVRKNLYQANYYLRRMGLNPTPPGHKPAVDASKRLVMGGLHGLRNGMRRIAGRPTQHGG